MEIVASSQDEEYLHFFGANNWKLWGTEDEYFDDIIFVIQLHCYDSESSKSLKSNSWLEKYEFQAIELWYVHETDWTMWFCWFVCSHYGTMIV